MRCDGDITQCGPPGSTENPVRPRTPCDREPRETENQGGQVSLEVSPDLLAAAERGDVADEEFAECVRISLPYAWQTVSRLSTRLLVEGGPFADNIEPPATETERGQLLRALASDAIRGCLERYFGVKLAFQNCHRVAVFPAAE